MQEETPIKKYLINYFEGKGIKAKIRELKEEKTRQDYSEIYTLSYDVTFASLSRNTTNYLKLYLDEFLEKNKPFLGYIKVDASEIDYKSIIRVYLYKVTQT